ncbi:hypothetical protein PMI31_02690 [Pseudomonas sp. GM55]|nr:hypothetical protein PMI31_02690 [Pseudomonas sp. GM55]
MHTQNCDIMQIFRIMCKGLYLEIFLIHRTRLAALSVGASLLAMILRATRPSRMNALSFTFIASKLAPTDGAGFFTR